MFQISEIGDKNSFLIEAKGKITKEDYLNNLVPFLDKIKNEGRRIKIIFHTADDFFGYDLNAVWEDFKLGIHHFHSFEKIAVVSDFGWIKNSMRFFSPLIPCSVKIFDGKDFSLAKDWLSKKYDNLVCNFNQKTAIATIEIRANLEADDFKIISNIIDPWIEKNGQLNGIIIYVKEFPFWENISGFFEHLSFVKNHHKKVKKVALVADGKIANLAPKMASCFVKSEIRHFDYDDFNLAEKWILQES